MHNFNKWPELTNNQMNFYYFDSPHKQITEGFVGTVTQVHDGDTISVKTDFRNFDTQIRFANINALELNHGGEESREWLKKQIEKQEVYIKVDKNNRVGKFGRIIGEVFFGGVSMNDLSLQMFMSRPFGQEIYE